VRLGEGFQGTIAYFNVHTEDLDPVQLTSTRRKSTWALM